ncbi:MAG: serine O-acetyltransferase [Actinobacteria bacterium]|nr:serine O-acetyltransferase [Actinomycetota bacterium]
MFRTLKAEMRTIFDKDPAARSAVEIFFTYPGFHAIVLHRLAHWLNRRHIPLVPRIISQFSRFITGIEIHPGAKIGRRFFIDHGMGVVIGETAEIGDDVLLYQGVTLGGTGKEKGKRHPTLGNNVVVGAGAKILGAITIGENAKVGAGSVVVKQVPAGTTVIGVPGRIVLRHGETLDPLETLEHGHLPDPEAQAIKCLGDKLRELEKKIELITKAPAAVQPLRLVEGEGADVPNGEAGKLADRDYIEEFIMGAGI